MFACPKCRSNCSYTELQTRSADEGTIFLFCHALTVWTQEVN
jgi:DNA-directed RNA polymerase subunit M/transcription elongation factor TFIIS